MAELVTSTGKAFGIIIKTTRLVIRLANRRSFTLQTITVTGFRERTNFRAWPTVAVADKHPL
jgi:hypothetical protein